MILQGSLLHPCSPLIAPRFFQISALHSLDQLRFSSHELSALKPGFRSSHSQLGLSVIPDLKAPPPERGLQALHRASLAPQALAM